MTLANILVLVMVCLQFGATVAYICSRQWNLVIYWGSAAMINASVLWRTW